jgi:hypothetical protein
VSYSTLSSSESPAQPPNAPTMVETAVLHALHTSSISASNSSGHPGPQTRTADEILECAVTVFEAKVYLQPLPLFGLKSLKDHLSRGPPFLRNSFFDLCTLLSAPRDQCSAQGSLDTARLETIKLASEGSCSLEVLESLCLLSLHEILSKCTYNPE